MRQHSPGHWRDTRCTDDSIPRSRLTLCDASLLYTHHWLLKVKADLVAFVRFGSLGMAAAVGALGVLIGAAERNVLTPWLMCRVGEMNAVAVSR
jgi:hypothetical protein